MVVDGATLQLDSAELWDDIVGNIDDWVGDIDNANGSGIADSGEYLFSFNGNNYFDLGDVYVSRITAAIESTVVDTGATWDNLFTGLDIDDWPGMIDGEDLSGTTVELQIRTTDDDPSGTPTYTDWRKFIVGDYSARGGQIKLVVTNDIPTNNINIPALAVSIDVPDRDEIFPSVAAPSTTLAAAGSTFTYAQPFFAQPFVGCNISSPTSGDTLKYTHVTSGGKYTGVTVQVLNGGVGVDRTAQKIIARGY
jgi:hypothetical protein